VVLKPGARCNARPVTACMLWTGRVICVCNWFRNATGLDFGDRSWICNAAPWFVLSQRMVSRTLVVY